MHIDVHADAATDLRAIKRRDAAAAAVVLALLQQLQADPDVIDKLTQHGNNDVAGVRVNVKRWQSARSPRGDLWRFRALDTPATSYRVVYGYHWPTRQICVLGAVHKDEFDYDDHSSPFAQRVLAAWRSL